MGEKKRECACTLGHSVFMCVCCICSVYKIQYVQQDVLA